MLIFHMMSTSSSISGADLSDTLMDRMVSS